MASGNDAPDRAAAEAALIALVADGAAVREPLGDDALWLSAGAAGEREPAYAASSSVSGSDSSP